MVEVGTVDRVTAIVGERGTGKSTLAKEDARSFQRETGGYAIGHSPNGQVGRAYDVEFHDDLRKLARGLRRHPERQHYVVGRRVGDRSRVLYDGPDDSVEAVLDYGQALALAVRRRAHRSEGHRFRENRPAPRGLRAPPVLVTVDEGSSIKRNPSQDEIAWLERLLTSARHKHLAITWSIQAPTARAWVLFEQASRIAVFRYTHEWGLNALRAAGVPREVVPEIPDLPRFAYYLFDKLSGRGSFLRVPKPPPETRQSRGTMSWS